MPESALKLHRISSEYSTLSLFLHVHLALCNVLTYLIICVVGSPLRFPGFG